jgi:hypothetical protein
MVEGGVNKQQRQRQHGNFYVQNRNRLQAMAFELSASVQALQEQQRQGAAKEQVSPQNCSAPFLALPMPVSAQSSTGCRIYV